ncbi:MAG: O-phospho-L-seryl-tRNA:Cys-tRNA synthase [Hadesarchaea archaeon]|nr:MAG: O-phospho-L-seryl-tRNA:Cys-tRNA synthase [Hadesarchaea archaeon]HDI12701.1 O-phospho-L-seryl-tRNA:Cys-tRNA synthase [Hadesarchaea archaeon]
METWFLRKQWLVKTRSVRPATKYGGKDVVDIPRERLDQYRNLKRDFKEEKYINLNPIQRGGILTLEAREALLEFGDGYSTCDWCPPKEARLDAIKRPPIAQFMRDLAEFLNMDVARVVTRCREAQFIVFATLGEPGDYVVVDSLAHYSTYIAAELARMKIKEVPHTGYPEFKLDLNAYADKIEEVRRDTGKLPAAVLLTHVDYLYGNLNDAAAVGKICKKYGVPFILNAAYTAGVMPVDGKKLGADIIVSSGHKSWAASAPTGILAIKEEFAEKVLARSKTVGDWSKRKFGLKEYALLGCTVMGAPLMSLMASFPHVVERVKRWGEEVENARYLVEQLERIEGTRQMGTKPKQHTLIHMESDGLYKASQTHKRRGFFLYDELKRRGIVGIQPGLTKHFKLNSYGLPREKVELVANAFLDIAREQGLNVS